MIFKDLHNRKQLITSVKEFFISVHRRVRYQTVEEKKVQNKDVLCLINHMPSQLYESILW